MPPKRKKSKMKVDDTAAPPADVEINSSATPAVTSSSQQKDTTSGAATTPNRSSWSWRSKASPTAQLAHESISVAQGTTSESSESARPPNSVSKSMRGSRKSIPLIAEATKVHAVSDGSKSRVASEAKLPDGKAAAEEKELVKEDAQLPPDPTTQADDTKDIATSARSSWFGWWSSTQNEKAAVEAPAEDIQVESTPATSVPAEPAQTETAVAAPEAISADDTKGNETQPKPSGWAFWSSDKPKNQAPAAIGTQKQIGELAVADTPSQNNPEAAQFNELQAELKTRPKQAQTLPRPKTAKPKKAKDLSEASTAAASPSSHCPPPSISSTPTEMPTLSEEVKPANKGKAARKFENFVLPSFRDTFPTAPNLGYMERLTQYLAQSLHIPGSQPSPPPHHVFITPSLPRIKKAVAIGVHGYFPGALIQKVLGQPTGTSIRFANHAATAIEGWCRWNQRGKDIEIEKVALEGAGYIADRVSMLWKLLLNWLSHLRSADLILIACHSQGVPVAIMLLAKLIQLGCLSPGVRIGVCAMAGVNLGPFPEYKSRLFGGSALELFEFCDSESLVSKSYSDSLDVCLRHGVRVTYVGSIDDQLVSLESSLHAPLSHPYVARAVFIDGRLHAPSFLTHLVVFALKLRNRGVSDHGLLRELSGPLAGSLVSGDGHSRIYDDPAVFGLAVDFTLESTDVDPLISSPDSGEHKKPTASKDMPATAALPGSMRRNPLSTTAASATGIAPTIAPYEAPPSTANANPFFLPWAVRGMLEERIVREDTKLRLEVEDLMKEFEAWKPVSKVLRDVRWRLEGIRSMSWYDMTFAN